MNLAEMQEDVRKGSGGSRSLADSDITSLLNEALAKVCGLVLLPGLETWTDVAYTPPASSINLPTDFSRALFSVATNVQPGIVVLPSFADLEAARAGQEDATTTQEIVVAAVRGSALHFWPTPQTALTFTLGYYKKPVKLAIGTDVPPFDDSFARETLCAYAKAELWRLREDGVGDPGANTQRYEQMFSQGVGRLRAWVHGQGGRSLRSSTVRMRSW